MSAQSNDFFTRLHACGRTFSAVSRRKSRSKRETMRSPADRAAVFTEKSIKNKDQDNVCDSSQNPVFLGFVTGYRSGSRDCCATHFSPGGPRLVGGDQHLPRTGAGRSRTSAPAA